MESKHQPPVFRSLTVERFRRNPDWRASFDAAFGVAPRNVNDTNYSGTIDLVRQVFVASRTPAYPYYSFAVVEFEPKCSPQPYALITSHYDRDHIVGCVSYFSELNSYLASQ